MAKPHSPRCWTHTQSGESCSCWGWNEGIARGVTQLAPTGFRSMRAMTFWRQNHMQHPRLDFKAGSAQNCTLWPLGQLEHQLCARSFWNIEITAPCDRRVLSPGHGRCPLTGNGVSPCRKVLGAHLLPGQQLGGPSPRRACGAPQQVAASRRKDSRTRVTLLLPRANTNPQTWAGSVTLWRSCVWWSPGTHHAAGSGGCLREEMLPLSWSVIH